MGDRYETFAVATASLIHNIPLAHLHGGEVTAGVIDEPLRHSITKMSDIHFTANKLFKSRIKKMGENKKNIYNVGSLTAENIKEMKFYKKKEIEKKFKFKFKKKNLIITVHPEKNFSTTQILIKNLLKSLKKISKEVLVIFTSPNADKDSNYIQEYIKKFIKKGKNLIYVANFQYEYYLSCVRYCNCVVGNSSSGITEIPLLNIPVINIGDRQKGRPLSSNIIQSDYKEKTILDTINSVLNKKNFITQKNIKSFYYKKRTRYEIVKILKKINLNKIKEKRFIDS